MPTVREWVERLLPEGANPDDHSVETIPHWPPDVFAVCAVLLDRSGCYSGPHVTGGYPPGEVTRSERMVFARRDYYRKIGRLADQWRDGDWRMLGRLWRALVRRDHGDIAEASGRSAESWRDLAFRLLVVADEVCTGMGFPPRPGISRDQSRQRLFADQYFLQTTRDILREPGRLTYLPRSIACMVPESECCVQPKTITPATGCTLRSFTHNLALLPGIGEVRTNWQFTGRLWTTPKNLNLLAVPFPYRVRTNCFVDEGNATIGSRRLPKSHRDHQGCRSGFFELRQDWLRDRDGGEIDEQHFGSFLVDLIREAQREVGVVHAVVLPEVALTRHLAEGVAEYLGAHADMADLELFISGVTDVDPESGIPRNAVFTAAFDQGPRPVDSTRKYAYSLQNKHHRWMLDRGQIRRYHLGASLDPDSQYWERIDLSGRACHFHVFRLGSSLAALICEDLARIDPVQSVIRSIGPNLVLALLMDGPQLMSRWSARYATILADDPGSSVLTLSSLGMVLRSADPGREAGRQVALWKQSGGDILELSLPKGNHALLLSLWPDPQTRFTLDGRSDRGTTLNLFLSGVQSVAHPSPPAWLAL